MGDRSPAIDGLPEWGAVDRGASSLIPYAELLRDIIDRRLYPTAGTDLVAPSYDRLLDDALRTVMEQMLTERLRSLSATEFVAAYRTVCGDDAFAAALGELAGVELVDVRRRAVLERAAREARVHGRVLLGELEAEEVLVVGLFDPEHPELAASRYRDNTRVRPLHRVLQVRLQEPASGLVEVLRDTWTGAVWSAELRGTPVEPMRTGRLGSRPASADGSELQAALSVHAPLVLELENGPAVTPPQIVGFVQTLDGRVLLDGP